MKQSSIEIGTAGTKRALAKYNTASSIAEFIWNGFDAGAKTVAIDFEENELGGVESLRLSDDGSGIPLSQLKLKFKPFLYSNKVYNPDEPQYGPSAKHGKNGIGRLTFFKFASKAIWTTTYRRLDGKFSQFSVEVSASTLHKFSETAESKSDGPSGTTIELQGIFDLTTASFQDVQDYLIEEFAWFLELQSPFSRKIIVNGDMLPHHKLIADHEERTIELAGNTFDIRYIRWHRRLHNEYSRYYFIDSGGRERAKQTTSFNNKGDDFYHSMFLKSSYFDSMQEPLAPLEAESEQDDQLSFPSLFERDETFRELRNWCHTFLRRKRTPFLRRRAVKYLEELEEDGAFPKFGDDVWNIHRKRELSGVVREVYEVEPRIFSGLNIQQKKTLLQLFSLVMESSEREELLEVLGQIVELSTRERSELAKILRTTKLANVVATIKLIEDRITAVNELRKMVFLPSFSANERDHLQTHIEHHYWLFGEQYHLVTAAEPDFEAALRKYLHILRGIRSRAKITHVDKKRAMDIFAVRWLPSVDQINNVVVELKHPNITLGSEQLKQVKDYMDVVLNEPQFNATNMSWDFYLVGKNYDAYIEREIENAKTHGEKHLAYKVTNYRIYILRWSEVFTNFEIRHNFLLEKLKVEREQLATREESADEVLTSRTNNSAIRLSATSPLITH
jgi:hypothetical protein